MEGGGCLGLGMGGVLVGGDRMGGVLVHGDRNRGGESWCMGTVGSGMGWVSHCMGTGVHGDSGDRIGGLSHAWGQEWGGVLVHGDNGVRMGWVSHAWGQE